MTQANDPVEGAPEGKWWYHGTMDVSEGGLLVAAALGMYHTPFFVTDRFVEAQYYALETTLSAHAKPYLRVFAYQLAPTAKLLDWTDPEILQATLPFGGAIDLPDGGPECWLRKAGYDGLRYDQSEVVISTSGDLVRDEGMVGEHHLLLVNPAPLTLVKVWRGTLWRGIVRHSEGELFTKGTWNTNLVVAQPAHK